jgi:hypothetical protein
MHSHVPSFNWPMPSPNYSPSLVFLGTLLLHGLGSSPLEPFLGKTLALTHSLCCGHLVSSFPLSAPSFSWSTYHCTNLTFAWLFSCHHSGLSSEGPFSSEEPLQITCCAVLLPPWLLAFLDLLLPFISFTVWSHYVHWLTHSLSFSTSPMKARYLSKVYSY